MSRRLMVSCVLLALAAGCGSSHSPECAFNSDCATGRYCSATGSCTADCTGDSECATMVGPGATCSSFGQCLAPPDAGPLPDAGEEDAGMSTDAGPRDGGPVDAGTDAGPPPEVCTPSTPGAVPTDENGDGVIDEGCPWYFGEPQFVTTFGVPVTAPTWAVIPGLLAAVSHDSLRMYYTGLSSSSRLYVASRVSADLPFTGGREIAVETAPNAQRAALSPDELEVFMQAGTSTILRATRATTSVDFGPPTVVIDPATIPLVGGAPCSSANDPFLSSDGLELVFTAACTGGWTLHSARRASLSAPFGTPTLLVTNAPPGPMVEPTLSPDEHTIFFTNQAVGSMYRAQRADVTDSTFTGATELPSLRPAASLTLVPGTREAYFNSGRDWSATGLWRVQVCRDAPCTPDFVACDTGVRSPDGLHCYFPGPSASGTYTDGRFGCASVGGHLPTVTSEAERALLWSRWGAGAGTYVWLAGTDEGHEGVWRWDWLDRVSVEEPFVFAPWGPGQPDNYRGNDAAGENLLHLNGDLAGAFNDIHAAFSTAYVCERELWPTW